MNYLPPPLISSLQHVQGFDEKSFVEVHHSDKQVTSVRLNPRKISKNDSPHDEVKDNFFWLPIAGKVPWSDNGYYLKERPLFYLDPLWHAGVYYVQEPSSMCLEFVLKRLCDLSLPLRVLDLCAAPGGKSTLMAGLLSEESVLVSNEVIVSRSGILQENMIKWGLPNVIVTQNDPEDFLKLKEYFDVILVDAPCSGSGLFRKDPNSVKEWSPEQVRACSQRQKRILADILPSLKENGLLIYTTCSFSQEENEDISDYLMRQFPLENISLPFHPEWNIVETDSPQAKAKGYRFYPNKLMGEGFFMSCFKKQDGETGAREKDRKNLKLKNVLSEIKGVQRSFLTQWIDAPDDFSFFLLKDRITAFPESSQHELRTVLSALKVIYAGIGMGKRIGNDLIPDHPLAVSIKKNKNIVSEDLGLSESIKYLRKEPLTLNGIPRGWILATYRHYGMGWLKSAGNRLNNYYPVNWRIRK